MKKTAYRDIKNDALSSFYGKWQQLLEDLKLLPDCRDLEDKLSDLIESLRIPFSLAVLGRIKTGKSTLINALIGKNLSLIGIKETTALINRISFAEEGDSGYFKVHWRNSVPKSFPISELWKWNHSSEEENIKNIQNTKFIELFAQAEELRDYYIIDTPGTGSIFSERDEISRQFIQGHGANAMIYVLSHTGHDSDKQQLFNYRSYMEDFGISSQDYCIAVLQKWDEVFWNSGSRDAINAVVHDIEQVMGDLVYRVIPVIAPWGLIAHPKNQKPDSLPFRQGNFWTSCLSQIQSYPTTQALCDVLLYSAKWDLQADQKALRLYAQQEGVPWNCFRLLLRELKEQGFREGQEEEARQHIWNISGICELDRVVKERFFKNASHLRAAQVCTRAESLMRSIITRVEECHTSKVTVMNHLKILLADKSLRQEHTESMKFLSTYEARMDADLKNMESISETLADKYESIISTHFDSSQRLMAMQALSESGIVREALIEICEESSGIDAETCCEQLLALLDKHHIDPRTTYDILPILTLLSFRTNATIRQVASYLKLLVYISQSHE